MCLIEAREPLQETTCLPEAEIYFHPSPIDQLLRYDKFLSFVIRKFYLIFGFLMKFWNCNYVSTSGCRDGRLVAVCCGCHLCKVFSDVVLNSQIVGTQGLQL